MFEQLLHFEGYDISSADRVVNACRALSGSELHAWQEKTKWELVRHHAAHNPLYREKIGGHIPSSWTDLPVMSKTDYQRELKGMLSKGFTRAHVYRANTSGSSGHPFSFAKDRFAHACTWSLIKQRYAWHGLSLGSLQARFYGIPLETLPHAKEKLKDLVMRRVRFPVFDLSDGILETFEKRFHNVRFDYVYGYTNSLVMFARYLIRKGSMLKSVCPSLKVCITTSEVCTREDRDLLGKAFGTPVVNEYGASEVGVIAFENPAGDWILSEENLFIEAVDEAGHPVTDGVSGALLITDLRNRAMPFIRYSIGDVGSLGASSGKEPGVRRRLITLDGRVNDTIVLPSGKRSPGLTFYYISRSVLESSGVLREFIIRQTGLRDFVFDVVSDRPLTSREEAVVKEKMDLYLEPGLNLTINRVPSIQRSGSGKIKHFFSELPA